MSPEVAGYPVLLDVDDAIPFLIERGLIDHAWILDGSLIVRRMERRNRNLKVVGRGGFGFLIKQPGYSMTDSRDTLCCEAEFHRLCLEEPAMAAVARAIPRLVAAEDRESILVFEAIPDAITLRQYFELGGSRRRAGEAAAALGRILGDFHRALPTDGRGDDPHLGWLYRGLPWVLSLHRPRPSLLATLGPAARELLGVLQRDESLWGHLDDLRRHWRSDAVIHGDIRFDNVLVRPFLGDLDAAPVRPWIVDWEMVAVGDPAWDLAGALQDLLVLWVSSMPMSEGADAEQMTAEARLPLDVLRDTAIALWDGYRRGAGLDTTRAEDLLCRAVLYSAARMVQSAFEYAGGAERLVGPAVLLLQIAANLLDDPHLGRVQLYGIPPGRIAS